MVWPAIGVLAIVVSFWLLAQELRDMSWEALWSSVGALESWHWWVIALCTVGCYVTLAFYDHIALEHLGRRLNFVFVAMCSLTTYAVAHNIGASVFTGAVVRYRAYTSKGLSGAEVGIIVSFCTFTFALGVMVLLGTAFFLTPELDARFADYIAPEVLRWIAFGLLLLVALYLVGSALKLPPLRIHKFEIAYPRLSIAIQQVIVAFVEQLFAAAIVYFALPEAGNPGYMVVMGVFVMAFVVALASHAPGGLGVFELAMITGLPEFRPETVLAAMIIFRLFYFILPLLIGLVTIGVFERHEFLRAKRRERRRARRGARS